jgi:hypothetical protein
VCHDIIHCLLHFYIYMKVNLRTVGVKLQNVASIVNEKNCLLLNFANIVKSALDYLNLVS